MAKQIKPKGLSFDETRSLIRTSLYVKHGVTENGGGYIYFDEIYPDSVIYTVEQPNTKSKKYLAEYSIDKDRKVTLSDPEEVVRKNVYETVTFSGDSLVFSADGKTAVLKDAILFECGNYPDKNFSLTEEEADSIVIPAFNRGIGIEVEHQSETVFSGLIGKVVSSWRSGTTIFGTVEFDATFAKLLKGKKPAFSVGFDTISKEPAEVSIVANPRIKKAGLLTAFSEDEQARNGGVMSFFGTLAEKLGLTRKEVEDGIKAEFTSATAPLETEIQRLKAENETLKQGQSTFSAVASANTADKLVGDFLQKGKITPAEATAAKAAFTQALSADGVTKFSANGQQEFGPVVTSLIASFEARPVIPHLAPGLASFAAMKGESEDLPERKVSPFSQLDKGGN